jgi:hypothetical protein
VPGGDVVLLDAGDDAVNSVDACLRVFEVVHRLVCGELADREIASVAI